MNRWLGRAVLIVAVASLVATLLPGIRQSLAVDRCLDEGGAYDYSRRTCRTDVQSLPAEQMRMLQLPDAGSLVVAFAVAIAMTRLFTTIDRRKRRASA
jgi:hypothetical protein